MTDTRKISMAVPLPQNLQSQMAKEGVYVLLNKNPALPNMGKKEIASIISELRSTGADDMLNSLGIDETLQLPFIIKPNKENLVEIDGKQYYVVDVIESKVAGKKQTIDGVTYQKGDNIAGRVTLMDIDTGDPVNLLFDAIKDKIRVPTELRQESLQEINKEIENWNKKLSAINDASGASRLVLQVKAAEDRINDRIETLKGQKSNVEKAIQNPLSVSATYGMWMQFLKENYRSFGAKDIFDTLLFLYQSTPQQLMEGLSNNTIQVPDEIKRVLMALASQELNKAQEKSNVEKQKFEEREERIEAPISEQKEPMEKPLQPLTLEEVPEKKYKTPSQYKTLYSWAASLKRMLFGIEQDMKDLQNIVNTFSGLRTYMGALEKGQRAEDYLKSREGKVIIEDLKKFLDACSMFFKRYSTDIIKDGKIDPSLLGRSGTIGNALIAVRLDSIYNTIKHTIANVETPEVMTEPTVEEPTKAPVREPVAATKVKLTKKAEQELRDQISNAFLQAFNRRNIIK